MNYYRYAKHITELCAKIGMETEHTASALAICRTICESEELSAAFRRLQNRYFLRGDASPEPVFALAESCGIERYMFTLAICLMYSLRTLAIYKARMYPMEVYYASFRDLVIWGEECEREHGVFGLKQYGWVSGQIAGRMFRIGRLQFHYIEHTGPDFSHAGVSVRSGQRVLNIHIPADEPLTRERRLDAYRRAYRFFGQTGNAVFECNSWLLFEKMRGLLNPQSNIVDFMNDFHLIQTFEKFDGFSDAWRVFGHRETYDPAELPRRTSLQRAYAERLASGGSTGSSLGVFIFDGENIL